ncbi:MAG: thiamine pyrophosphate-dependent enzyme, partial [Alphaproteobacteria bacterium]
GGYAVINRLQINKGGEEFNNLIASSRRRVDAFSVDFAMNAQSQGAEVERVSSIAELDEALVRARAADKTYVISIDVAAYDWTEGGCFWETGVPEVSPRQAVLDARDESIEGKKRQRVGV